MTFGHYRKGRRQCCLLGVKRAPASVSLRHLESEACELPESETGAPMLNPVGSLLCWQLARVQSRFNSRSICAHTVYEVRALCG